MQVCFFSLGIAYILTHITNHYLQRVKRLPESFQTKYQERQGHLRLCYKNLFNCLEPSSGKCSTLEVVGVLDPCNLAQMLHPKFSTHTQGKQEITNAYLMWRIEMLHSDMKNVIEYYKTRVCSIEDVMGSLHPQKVSIRVHMVSSSTCVTSQKKNLTSVNSFLSHSFINIITHHQLFTWQWSRGIRIRLWWWFWWCYDQTKDT